MDTHFTYTTYLPGTTFRLLSAGGTRAGRWAIVDTVTGAIEPVGPIVQVDEEMARMAALHGKYATSAKLPPESGIHKVAFHVREHMA